MIDTRSIFSLLGGAVLYAGSAQAGLIAYYPLDGDASDAMGNYDGTVIDNPAWVTGKNGQAINPNYGGSGSSDTGWVQVAGGVPYGAGNTSFTIGYWAIAETDKGNENYAITQGQGTSSPRRLAQIGHSGSTTYKTEFEGFQTTTGNPQTALGINTTDGNFHYYTIRYDASAGSNQYQVYVDGQLLTQATNSGGWDGGTASELRIGARSIWFSLYDGAIDDVAIWDEALTTADIQALAANTKTAADFVPEPSSLALIGLGGLLFVRRRR